MRFQPIALRKRPRHVRLRRAYAEYRSVGFPFWLAAYYAFKVAW